MQFTILEQYEVLMIMHRGTGLWQCNVSVNTHLCLVYNCWYSCWGTKSEASLQYGLTYGWKHHNNSAVQQGKSRQHRQKDEPEPQEDVDLLIQYVKGQDTQCIMLLNCACEQYIYE